MNQVWIIISLLALAIVAIIAILSYAATLLSFELEHHDPGSEYAYDLGEQIILIRQIRLVVIILASLAVFGGALYWLVHDSLMQGFTVEWLNLVVRWVHVVAGIMWIGASFYFIFLENNLNRTENIRDELAGNLWAIHGGGFYFLEKYKVAPKVVPKNLHWFKYEAYFTWMSGFALLAIVYYLDAKAFLIDTEKISLSPAQAISISAGSLIIGWIIYDRMCKSSLAGNLVLFSITGFVILSAFAFFFLTVFNSRAAYIHVGALIGTLMAWNVYFVIIPSQKSLVRAAVTGKPLDPSLGKKAGERSLHNNYFTLPVIFIMISNHFPSTFGNKFNWILLVGVCLASAGIKHYWNLRDRGEKSTWILPLSVVALISLALISSPAFEPKVEKPPVAFSEVNAIFALRCTQCHSKTPTDKQWTTAPNGVKFDTADEIVKMQEKIMTRAVLTNSMPQGNVTKMTDAEREVIKTWIMQGAKTTD
jgi:uncharacterized membrane protein